MARPLGASHARLSRPRPLPRVRRARDARHRDRLRPPGARAEAWGRRVPDHAASRSRAPAELEVLQALRPTAKAALVGEARRDPAWGVLRTIPFLGPVRVALLLATPQTPWRFRTKRQLWAYAGLAVVTRASAEYALDGHGRPVRRRRPPMTRGLNRNHNHVGERGAEGRGDGARGPAGRVPGVLPRVARAGHAGRAGPGDPHAEARGPHAAALENGGAVRSSEAHSERGGSALAPGPRGDQAARCPPRRRRRDPGCGVREAVSI